MIQRFLIFGFWAYAAGFTSGYFIYDNLFKGVPIVESVNVGIACTILAVMIIMSINLFFRKRLTGKFLPQLKLSRTTVTTNQEGIGERS